MKNTQLFSDNIANEDLFHNTTSLTLKETYNIMKDSYGPYGSHILIDNTNGPEATKDGRTILSSITMSGSISNAVLRSIVDVANKQVEEVGDGSTTTILLLCKLYEAFRKVITTYNCSPSYFREILIKLSYLISDRLKVESTPILYDEEKFLINEEMLYSVIFTAVDGNVQLAKTITELIKAVGCKDPFIMIKGSPSIGHSFKLVKGIEIDGSIIGANLFFGGYSRMNYDHPKVMVVNGQFCLPLDIYCTLCDEYRKTGEELIILAGGINPDLLNGLNQLNEHNPHLFDRCPVFQIKWLKSDTEFLDTCAMLGAKPIDEDSLKKVKTIGIFNSMIAANCGKCDGALMTEFLCKISEPQADEAAIANRIQEIDEKISMLKEDPNAQINSTIPELEKRKRTLSRNYANLYVGGESDQRKAINYEAADDGVRQAISSMNHGVVSGCNIIVPKIIDYLIAIHQEFTPIELSVLNEIKCAYEELYIQLINNKYNDMDKSREVFNENKNTALNLRGENNIAVINSADTDRAILSYAMDMASLLATSKGFLSLMRKNDFDIVTKGYDL